MVSAPCILDSTRRACVWYAVRHCGRPLRTELDHQLRSLPIALPGIPTPALDDPKTVTEDDLREFVGRVTPPGDLQHRVLDPGAADVAAIDQLQVQGVPLGIEA